jgi:hypothetical protein
VFMVGRSRRGDPGELVPSYEVYKRFAPGGELCVRGMPAPALGLPDVALMCLPERSVVELR